MGGRSQTAKNLLTTGECVINPPSAPLASAVDALALTTGRAPVPAEKERVGYRHVRDKLAAAGLHGRPGDTVGAERIDECPVNLEARVVNAHPLAGQDRATTRPSCSRSRSPASTCTMTSVHPGRRTASTPTGGGRSSWPSSASTA